MTIYLLDTNETKDWKNFFNHFSISFETAFDSSIADSLVIVDYDWIEGWENSPETITNLLDRNNQILVVYSTDAPIKFYRTLTGRYNTPQWIVRLDAIPNANQISFIVEATTVESLPLKNLNILTDSRSKFFPLTETRITLTLDKKIEHDFLLTMGRQMYERDQLWGAFAQTNLLSNSIAFYHKKHPLKPGGTHDWYLGENSVPLNPWKTQVPSLDFYTKCAVEIGVETIAEKVCWFTEKTIRPIAAKTPALILNAPGSIKELTKLGFKTFGSLIDESYDDYDTTHARIEKLVNTCKYIRNQGADQFYTASKDILEHNWNRLVEIQGRYQIDQDQKFLQILDSYGHR